MIAKFYWKFKSLIRFVVHSVFNPLFVKGKTKVFCIGKNKTGTTSLKRAFEDLGFVVGNQKRAFQLLRCYIDGNFVPIIQFCKSAQVFQDFPFSFPETYKHLDKAYPGSKFILSIRDTPEQWYESITKFHAKFFGRGSIPTTDQLRESNYIWRGWIWELIRHNYDTPDDDPYNRDIFITRYLQYNAEVVDYFKDRPNDLIVINISEAGSYERLTNFLGIESPFEDFPWENKTSDRRIKT